MTFADTNSTCQIRDLFSPVCLSSSSSISVALIFSMVEGGRKRSTHRDTSLGRRQQEEVQIAAHQHYTEKEDQKRRREKKGKFFFFSLKQMQIKPQRKRPLKKKKVALLCFAHSISGGSSLALGGRKKKKASRRRLLHRRPSFLLSVVSLEAASFFLSFSLSFVLVVVDLASAIMIINSLVIRSQVVVPKKTAKSNGRTKALLVPRKYYTVYVHDLRGRPAAERRDLPLRVAGVAQILSYE